MENSLYGHFRVDDARDLTDFNLIKLSIEVTAAEKAMSKLRSPFFRGTCVQLGYDKVRLLDILRKRGIGYSLVEGNVLAIKIIKSRSFIFKGPIEELEVKPTWDDLYCVPLETDSLLPQGIADLATFESKSNWDLYKNHYKYLEAILPIFWIKATGRSLEDSGCAGIIGAHGDKCYQYRDTWDEVDVPFFRGTLLYMMTYSSQHMPHAKHHSCWAVIEFYVKYRSLIEECEKEFEDSIVYI